MADQWHYGSGGKQQGPVSFEQLQQLAASGQIDGSILVWKEGMADWTPATKIENLMPAPAASGKDEWHYGSGGQQQGPVTFERLQQLASAGEIKPNDQVWKDGMADWTDASMIDELKFAQPAPAAPSGPPPMRKAAPSVTSQIPGIMLSIPILVGLGFLFLAFITPWWSLTINMPDKDADREEIEEYVDAGKKWSEIQKDNKDWYEGREINKKLRDKLRDKDDDDDSASVSLWGWGTGTGLMGFIFVFVITPLILVMMFVSVLRPWSWIAQFVAAITGLLMLIMFLLWFFGAPSKNASPVASQGLIIGPYLVMFGGFLLLGGGILAGILGLRAFIASAGSKAA